MLCANDWQEDREAPLQPMCEQAEAKTLDMVGLPAWAEKHMRTQQIAHVTGTVCSCGTMQKVAQS